MNHFPPIALALFLLSPSQTVHAEDKSFLPAPVWLAGGWSEVTGDDWSEEWWTTERGGLMLGSGRSGTADVATGFDHMRITRESDGGLVFWGSPNGAPAVPFKATSVTEASIAFENNEHDFPNVIRYQKLPDGRLKATIVGKNGKEMSWTWTRIVQ